MPTALPHFVMLIHCAIYMYVNLHVIMIKYLDRIYSKTVHIQYSDIHIKQTYRTRLERDTKESHLFENCLPVPFSYSDNSYFESTNGKILDQDFS